MTCRRVLLCLTLTSPVRISSSPKVIISSAPSFSAVLNCAPSLRLEKSRSTLKACSRKASVNFVASRLALEPITAMKTSSVSSGINAISCFSAIINKRSIPKPKPKAGVAGPSKYSTNPS